MKTSGPRPFNRLYFSQPTNILLYFLSFSCDLSKVRGGACHSSFFSFGTTNKFSRTCISDWVFNFNRQPFKYEQLWRSWKYGLPWKPSCLVYLIILHKALPYLTDYLTDWRSSNRILKQLKQQRKPAGQWLTFIVTITPEICVRQRVHYKVCVCALFQWLSFMEVQLNPLAGCWLWCTYASVS